MVGNTKLPSTLEVILSHFHWLSRSRAPFTTTPFGILGYYDVMGVQTATPWLDAKNAGKPAKLGPIPFGLRSVFWLLQLLFVIHLCPNDQRFPNFQGSKKRCHRYPNSFPLLLGAFSPGSANGPATANINLKLWLNKYCQKEKHHQLYCCHIWQNINYCHVGVLRWLASCFRSFCFSFHSTTTISRCFRLWTCHTRL